MEDGKCVKSGGKGGKVSMKSVCRVGERVVKRLWKVCRVEGRVVKGL